MCLPLQILALAPMAGLCLSSAAVATDMSKEEAIGRSRLCDAILGTVAVSIAQTDLSGSPLIAESASWSIVMSPSRFELETKQQRGSTDSDEVGTIDYVSFGDLRELTWWVPIAFRAQVGAYDSELTDRSLRPWQSTVPYLYFLPPGPTAATSLGLTGLLETSDSVLVALSAPDLPGSTATHMLTCPATSEHPVIVVWVDFSAGTKITRYRLGDLEMRATTFLDVAGSSVPKSISLAWVDDWTSFELTGKFPEDCAARRYDLMTSTDGSLAFVTGEAAESMFQYSLTSLPAGTTIYSATQPPRVVGRATSPLEMARSSLDSLTPALPEISATTSRPFSLLNLALATLTFAAGFLVVSMSRSAARDGSRSGD